MSSEKNGSDYNVSNYSDLQNRTKHSRLRGNTKNTKKEITEAFNQKKRQKEDALLRTINQTHPSSDEVIKQSEPSSKEIKDNFDSFIGRKAA